MECESEVVILGVIWVMDCEGEGCVEWYILDCYFFLIEKYFVVELIYILCVIGS